MRCRPLPDHRLPPDGRGVPSDYARHLLRGGDLRHRQRAVGLASVRQHTILMKVFCPPCRRTPCGSPATRAHDSLGRRRCAREAGTAAARRETSSRSARSEGGFSGLGPDVVRSAHLRIGGAVRVRAGKGPLPASPAATGELTPQRPMGRVSRHESLASSTSPRAASRSSRRHPVHRPRLQPGSQALRVPHPSRASCPVARPPATPSDPRAGSNVVCPRRALCTAAEARVGPPGPISAPDGPGADHRLGCRVGRCRRPRAVDRRNFQPISWST